ncbi:SusC/RagA family TonB-linked outer membrane protein [Leadbetterella sp. DM7]|uniref:SusC/RagA family TonB-linked outer membrane protein n=1 Tax=Leadbetterella sp. DM7 TaxID=3235085 RepID=UPI00349EEB01
MKVKIIFILGLMIFGRVNSGITQNNISGKIIDAATDLPVSNVSIKVLDSDNGTTSDSLGMFSLIVKDWPITLLITHVGYERVYWPLNGDPKVFFEIRLKSGHLELDEVVISTGYQQIPRERMTGSFSQVDRELFNRRVSPDILARLEDVVPGLIFNRRHGANNISIRGRNTISGDGQPLIVVDNFPFEGDLSSLNPNDIENVTVLRDAAASSIWGARAGNGVIVITTRKGAYQRAPVITFNTNITVAEKPNQYYQPQMSSTDYINWEQFMFQRGYYNSFINSPNMEAFTPAVELLFQQNNGQISEDVVKQQIESLKGYDLRRDINKYLYRYSLNSQYSLTLSGGTANQKYALSVGYDKILPASIGERRERITLNANHTYGLFNNKLEINTGIYYSGQSQERNSLDQLTYQSIQGTQPLYPYARLADEHGRSLIAEKNHRLSYAEKAIEAGLLNWTYNPLEEMKLFDKTTRGEEIRLRAGLNYKILPFLNAEIFYLYQKSTSLLRDHYSVSTYFTRDLINQYTQIGADGRLVFPIPKGGILDRGISTMAGHSLRGQLNFSKKAGIGELDAIAGAELRDHHTERVNSRWYGYDDEYATSVQVDYVTSFAPYIYPSGFRTRIPGNSAQSYLIDRYLSFYTNAAYSIENKYVLSGSTRLDQSNLFGVGANQKGVPLWSAGLAWVMSSDEFMKEAPLSYLRMRATYGSGGNVNKSLSAKTTASFSSGDLLSLLPYATIQNPPNPSLRWEKVKTLNFGLDFETRNGRVGGSVEYYLKRGLDLFGQVPYAPSTGISVFNGNTAATQGRGVDLSTNLQVLRGRFDWNINFLFSYLTDRVTEFKTKYSTSLFLTAGESGGYVREGKPQYALYSYDYAGLDPENGDPLGYLDGQVSNDWRSIIQRSTIEDLRYHGSARPTMFGSFRNTLRWRNFTLSSNVSYRMGYYFRRSSVNYAALWLGLIVHGDYEKRWKQPGDELLTSVPSIPNSLNAIRNQFYMNSAALVEKGDHIRLQDVQLSYTLKKVKFGNFELDNGQIYVYANNLGIIWKATKTNLDPDYPISNFPPQSSLAGGIRFNF